MTLLSDAYASFVNLDSRPDRLKRMLRSLEAAGVTAARTRGILPSEYKGDPARVEVMRRRTPGAIGCWESQITVMEEALRREKHAFVMEDDLVFCRDFGSRVGHLETFVGSRPWDVLWLGATFHVGPGSNWHHDTVGRDAELTDDPRVVRTYGCWSTYAYIVNRTSLRAVLWFLDRMQRESIGIDWAFIQMQPYLHTYAYVPGCVKQYDNRSDIGRGVTYFSKFSELGPYWYQDYADRFDPTSFDWKECRV